MGYKEWRKSELPKYLFNATWWSEFSDIWKRHYHFRAWIWEDNVLGNNQDFEEEKWGVESGSCTNENWASPNAWGVVQL